MPAAVSNAPTEAGGDARDQQAVDFHMLGDRQQHALGSTKAGIGK